MKEDVSTLSLFGGPLHRLGVRLGLVHGIAQSTRLGLALGVGSWLVLVALAAIDGHLRTLFSLPSLGAHVRLLGVIPLFFVCEALLAPRFAELVPTIVRSGIVPSTSRPALDSVLQLVRSWTHGGTVDALALALALLLLVGSGGDGAMAPLAPLRFGSELGLADVWYSYVCLTLFRFLLVRWLGRLIVWTYFLARFGRLELHLVPTHPDGSAGLGYLEVVASYFGPLVFALSMLFSVAFAEEIHAGAATFESLYPSVALVVAIDALVFLGPLFLVAPKLWRARVLGIESYMELAAQYTNRFDRKWVAAGDTPSEALLGTPDLQSLADLGSSVAVVHDMRWIPIGRRVVVELAVAALLPMVPLLLFRYPLAQIAQRLFSVLTGL